MKYFIIILLFACYSNSKSDNYVYLYNEFFGPMESFAALNAEIRVFDANIIDSTNGSLRIRGGIRLMGLVLLAFYPSYLAGLHYIIGNEHKLDLGVNFLHQEFTEFHVFNTSDYLSLNIGYRHNIGDKVFVGFAVNPTYSKENKPFYPTSLKFGFVLF